MTKFLNISFQGIKTDINVSGFDRMSQVQDKIKEKFGDDIPASAARIQVSDQEGTVISRWASINTLPEEYFAEGGLCLAVSILPAVDITGVVSSTNG